MADCLSDSQVRCSCLAIPFVTFLNTEDAGGWGFELRGFEVPLSTRLAASLRKRWSHDRCTSADAGRLPTHSTPSCHLATLLLQNV